MVDSDLARAVVRVGGGRGFLIEAKRRQLIITAAHCLPHLPSAHPARYIEEQTYSNLLGALDAGEPTVWAECLFADPTADIAVLGEPDSQALYDECKAYEALMDGRPALRIGDSLPVDTSGRLTMHKGAAWVLTLDGRWVRCVAKHASDRVLRAPLMIESALEGIECGMSGSPILADDATAIGIISIGDRLNPRLLDDLPGWLLRARDVAPSKGDGT